MVKRAVKISSLYGPVDIELVSCDNPECTLQVQESLMVGWHKLSSQGIKVQAFGDPPDDLDFCSLQCVHTSVSRMTGNQ